MSSFALKRHSKVPSGYSGSLIVRLRDPDEVFSDGPVDLCSINIIKRGLNLPCLTLDEDTDYLPILDGTDPIYPSLDLGVINVCYISYYQSNLESQAI